MYNERPNLMLGFHGCDESVMKQLINNPNEVKISQKTFDWLGHGFYVWENNYERALQWAKDRCSKGKIDKPAVVGIVYQLMYCLDFSDSYFINRIERYFLQMRESYIQSKIVMPRNKDAKFDIHHDLILRELDCSVIEFMHRKIEQEIQEEIYNKGFCNIKSFDSVRGIFTEGGPAFEGAGIQSKNHIQICIRNLNCIKGFFIPRKEICF
jgi:hypothetical protein